MKPPEIPLRGRLNMLVRNHVSSTSTNRTCKEYAEIWHWLYRQLYYRCHYDVKARCRHSGRKRLDQIEADGMMEDLYSIALHSL